MDKFTEFVISHADDDTARLLLSKEKYPDIDMDLAVSTIEVRKRLRKKLPSWYSRPELVYPVELSCEQCSSESTALYKARLVSGLSGRDSRVKIADLTGGLGADSRAFSEIAESVLYNEMNPVLAAAARDNFRNLGCHNIIIRSYMLVSRDSIVPGMEGGTGSRPADIRTILDGFAPDLIFLDPARRSGSGRKVFLPEDCSPDVFRLKDELLENCRYLLVKLSPLADISLVAEKSGKMCREIHIVAASGECKELLLLLDREYCGECSIAATSGGAVFRFTREEEESAAAMAASPEDMQEGTYLFEPGKALMKSGAYNLISAMSGMKKLGKSTHYYLSGSPSELPAGIRENGKLFRIVCTAPLDRKSMKDIGRRFPEAEVTARNIKMDTETLRKRLGVSSGDDFHIFGLKFDFPEESANMLIVTGKAGV